MNIIEKHLPNKEYYQQVTNKHQIVLHHTVSMSFESTYSWWIKDGIHVGVAYVIDKDGTIYETFNPEYWAYHLGHGTNALNNKSAVGIEIINEGTLVKKDNNDYYWWNGTAKYNGNAYDNKTEWRGSRYYAGYTEEQYSSVLNLLFKLTEQFRINREVITTYSYDKSLLYKNCIISHHNVRLDKTDVSVALDLNKLNDDIKNK